MSTYAFFLLLTIALVSALKLFKRRAEKHGEKELLAAITSDSDSENLLRMAIDDDDLRRVMNLLEAREKRGFKFEVEDDLIEYALKTGTPWIALFLLVAGCAHRFSSANEAMARRAVAEIRKDFPIKIGQTPLSQ